MNPLTTSVDIRTHLTQEEQVILDKGGSDTPPDTALATVPSKPPHPTCLNCKRPGHCTEYCIAPGGAYAGKTVKEARAAQNAARGTGKPHGSNVAHAAITQPSSGKPWFFFSCFKCFFYLPQVNKAHSVKSTEYFSQDIGSPNLAQGCHCPDW
jgi:hypothetical protein